jgi:hypothetical protein
MGDASKLATAIDLQCYDLLSERRCPQMLGQLEGVAGITHEHPAGTAYRSR